jgi:Protein of unknown function (DUF1573)
MRLIALIVISAVFGTAVGATLAYVDAWPAVRTGTSRSSPSSPSGPVADASGPHVEVDEPTYQFGTMQRGTKMSHAFVFRNVGNAPLTIHVLSTTCKCTAGNVPAEPVAPGKSTSVTLEWRALVSPGPFRQSAQIETNDPLQSHVSLSVEGEVSEASGVWPPDFIFDKVTAGKEKSADVFVMALTQDTLEVGDPTLSNPDTRKFFDVQVEPVDRASLPNPKAKQGVRIRVTAKPGLPIGHFDQYLSISTNIPDANQLEIPIFGRVVGNITVHGHLWSEDRGALMLGNVKSDEGTTDTLNLVIRGSGADAVQMEVAAIDPPELVAKLGEPKRLKATLVHVPLTIEIPPGTPPMVRLDTDQSDGGRITLKTSHADAPEMVLRVQFTVER